MTMPTRYSTLLMRAYGKTTKYYPAIDISRHKIYAEQSQKKCFVSSYRHRFRGYKLNIFPDGALIYEALQMKVLLYTQYGHIFFPPPWMDRPQYYDQNNQ